MAVELVSGCATELCKKDIGIITGMIFGDGCIPNGKKYFRVWHSTKQKEYVEHKRDVLSNIFGSNIKISLQSQKHYSGNIYKTCGFSVHNKDFFTKMYNEHYFNCKKEYTPQNLRMLNAEGLAYWFMDDGSTGCRIHKERGKTEPSSVYLELATYCSLKEACMIKSYFNDVWEIFPRTRKSQTSSGDEVYNINFNTKESKKFYEVIKQHIIPSMEYKLRFMDIKLSRDKKEI